MSVEEPNKKSASGQAAAAKRNALSRFLCSFVIVAGLILSFLAFEQNNGNSWILLFVGLYAAFGLFFLLCTAFGICHFGFKEKSGAAAADILDNLAPAIVLTDKQGRFVYGNKTYRQLAGTLLYSPEILLARDGLAAAAVYRLSEAAGQGRLRREVLRYKHNPFLPFTEDNSSKTDLQDADKTSLRGTIAISVDTYTCSVDVRPFFYAGHHFAMWTIVETDELQNHNDFIYHLQQAVSHFDNMPAGFLSWDEQGEVVFFNAFLSRLLYRDFSLLSAAPSLADLLGRENAEALSLKQQILQQKPAAGQNTNAANKNNEMLELELANNSRGQTEHLYFYINAGQNSENGLFHALVLPKSKEFAPFTDIQDKNRFAVSAQPPDNKTDILSLAEYLSYSPIALAVIERGAQFMDANIPFAALFGLNHPQTAQTEQEHNDQRKFSDKKEQKTLEDFLAAVAEPQRPLLLGTLKRAFESGAEPSTLPDITPAEAESRSVRLYITPLRPRQYGFDTIILSAVETTRQRALEQEMEHSQKMQAVGQLAGGIAHDFNNVLTAIIMSCDLLLSSHRSSDPSHPDILNIKHNAERAASLVRQLLAFSRRQTLRPEILDITDMLADLRMLAVRLAGKDVHLRIEHGSSLWKVKADQAQLQRVIMNLVANARDAMPRGGDLLIRTDNISEAVSRTYPYQGFVPGDYVLIEIVDKGVGIPAEIIEKIFDPFFTTKEVGKGTGLGLSTVYGIIRQTGGYIYCRSTLGKGTIFSIFLPRAVKADENIASAVNRDTKPAINPINGNGRADEEKRVAMSGNSTHFAGNAGEAADLSGSANVLLVEDEDAVRMGGVKALQSRGYKVFEAGSGVEALRIIKEQNGAIDIVVSDVVMPEMDGPTLLKELRHNYPDIKFIFVSGYAREAFAKNLPKDADFSFLPKPFSLKQLAGLVKTMLQADIQKS